ncbi:hypothetical protein BDN72DRAFT_727131, partial [Pluteus cervinus]
IDKEILMLQECIRSLRSTRNALSPIHRLPPEVLEQIFKQLQHLYRGRERWPTSLYQWIMVTHVSQRWRYSAQSCQSLYSTLFIENLRYSQEMLERSGGVALELI